MNLPTAMNTRTPGHHLIRNRQNDFQNLVAAEVTRLKHPRDQSLLTSAATEFDALPPSAFAFTRAELLVLLAVLSLLALIVLPALAHDRARSSRIQCANNLRQVAVAMQMWGNDHNDQVPWNVSVTEGGTRAHLLAANVWLHFSWMSNELTSAKAIFCPSDTGRPASDFGFAPSTGYLHPNLRGNATSYLLSHAFSANPDVLLAADRNMGSDQGIGGCSVFVSALWSSSYPSVGAFVWNTTLHNSQGNFLRGDGRVEQLSNQGLRDALSSYRSDGNGSIHFITPR